MDKFIDDIDERDEIKDYVLEEIKQIGIRISSKAKKVEFKLRQICAQELPSGHFGKPLHLVSSLVVPNGGMIPRFLVEACVFLEQHLETEGLFRKSGVSLRQRDIRRQLEAGGSLPDESGVHDVTGLIKQFFRELPWPLLTYHMHNVLIRASELPEHTRTRALLLLCLLLPAEHVSTLRYLCCFLQRVAKCESLNRMTEQNLAVIFTPNILYVNDKVREKLGMNESELLAAQTRVVLLLIHSAHHIGMVSPQIVECARALCLSQISSSTAGQLCDEELTIQPFESGSSIESRAARESPRLRRKRRSGSLQGLLSNLSSTLSKLRGGRRSPNTSRTSTSDTACTTTTLDLYNDTTRTAQQERAAADVAAAQRALNNQPDVEATPKLRSTNPLDSASNAPFSTTKRQAILSGIGASTPLLGTPFTPAAGAKWKASRNLPAKDQRVITAPEKQSVTGIRPPSPAPKLRIPLFRHRSRSKDRATDSSKNKSKEPLATTTTTPGLTPSKLRRSLFKRRKRAPSLPDNRAVSQAIDCSGSPPCKRRSVSPDPVNEVRRTDTRPLDTQRSRRRHRARSADAVRLKRGQPNKICNGLNPRRPSLDVGEILSTQPMKHSVNSLQSVDSGLGCSGSDILAVRPLSSTTVQAESAATDAPAVQTIPLPQIGSRDSGLADLPVNSLSDSPRSYDDESDTSNCPASECAFIEESDVLSIGDGASNEETVFSSPILNKSPQCSPLSKKLVMSPALRDARSNENINAFYPPLLPLRQETECLIDKATAYKVNKKVDDIDLHDRKSNPLRFHKSVTRRCAMPKRFPTSPHLPVSGLANAVSKQVGAQGKHGDAQNSEGVVALSSTANENIDISSRVVHMPVLTGTRLQRASSSARAPRVRSALVPNPLVRTVQTPLSQCVSKLASRPLGKPLKRLSSPASPGKSPKRYSLSPHRSPLSNKNTNRSKITKEWKV